MDALSQYLIRYSAVTAETLALARLGQPRTGVLEALKQLLQPGEYERVLLSCARGAKAELLSEKELFAADSTLLAQHSQCPRLVERLSALPLGWTSEGADRRLKLALADPFDRYPQNVFSTLFAAPVEPYLAEASAIRAALLHHVGAAPKLDTASKVQRALARRELFAGEEEALIHALEELFVGLIRSKTVTADVEFLSSSVRVQQYLAKRTLTQELSVSPEACMQAVLNRLIPLPAPEGALFRGVVRFELPLMVVSAIATFYRRRAGATTLWNVLELREIEVNSADREPLWITSPPEHSRAVKALVDSTPGFYLAAVRDMLAYKALVASLLAACPDIYIADSPETAFQDPTFCSYARFSRVLVPLKADDVPHALKLLEKLPAERRTQLAAVISLGMVPRSCPLCVAQCRPGATAAKLLPQQLLADHTALPYPRGCPICRKHGYCGTVPAVSHVRLQGRLGERFRAGAAAEELLKELSATGFVSQGHTLLSKALEGATTVEQVLCTHFGNTTITPGEFLAVGKSAVVDGKEQGAPLTALTDSPLLEKVAPAKKDWSHSVVLQLDPSLLGDREELLREMKEEVFSQPEPLSSAPKGPSTSGHRYHSVVLELDGESLQLREALLAEQAKK